MSWRGTILGHATAGVGTAAASVEVLIGDRSSVVGQAFVNAVATGGGGTVLGTVGDGVMARPDLVIVNRSPMRTDEQFEFVCGPVRVGVCSAVLDCVKEEIIPRAVAEEAVMIVAVEVSDSVQSQHADMLCRNHEIATRQAVMNAVHQFPSVQDVLAHHGAVSNRRYDPRH